MFNSTPFILFPASPHKFKSFPSSPAIYILHLLDVSLFLFLRSPAHRGTWWQTVAPVCACSSHVMTKQNPSYVSITAKTLSNTNVQQKRGGGQQGVDF